MSKSKEAALFIAWLIIMVMCWVSFFRLAWLIIEGTENNTIVAWVFLILFLVLGSTAFSKESGSSKKAGVDDESE